MFTDDRKVAEVEVEGDLRKLLFDEKSLNRPVRSQNINVEKISLLDPKYHSQDKLPADEISGRKDLNSNNIVM